MTQLGIQHINFFVLDVEGTHQEYCPLLLIPFATFTALSFLDTKPNLAFASQAVL
jgi:hypothetical protein